MAVTAHWIENKVVNGLSTLHLRSDLIAFHRIPGSHTGEHLAEVFVYILERLGISNFGWITCDNASNNDTMMEYLEYLLKMQFPNSQFHSVDNRIR